MKILYAIQGTGNGHVSRAREIIPISKKKGDALKVTGTKIIIDTMNQKKLN
jgi:UDP:flavonoid glycosyltransferase YjiC (YdhE family)